MKQYVSISGGHYNPSYTSRINAECHTAAEYDSEFRSELSHPRVLALKSVRLAGVNASAPRTERLCTAGGIQASSVQLM
jgi:hypothetical protein